MKRSDQDILDAIMVDHKSRDSYVLYGSYARGDYDLSSDIDVLRITTRRIRSNRVDGHLSLHVYDIKDLRAMAQQGNLFILHLLREGRPLHDPCKYFIELSHAFQKPLSYVSEARRMMHEATCLLDINESLYSTASKGFMDTSIFLCRTILYAEYADRGHFSFSLRSLASSDETACLISGIKGRSASYSDFQTVGDVVRSKVGTPRALSNATSIDELTGKGHGDPLYEGLLRRIVEGTGFDPYVILAKSGKRSAKQNRS